MTFKIIPLSSFRDKVLSKPRYMLIIWCLVILAVFLKHNFLSTYHNNYFIFKYTTIHMVNGETMYGHHPGEYLDKNHYGPFFAVVFAPFAYLPNWMGHLLWNASLVFFLWLAVRSLGIAEWQKNAILLICTNELLTAVFNVQFNIAIAAMLVLTFVYIQKEKEWWAPLPSLLGTFVKLYGIVGFAFFFFVKNKWKFILASAIWAVVLFLLPMLLSLPEYVIKEYGEWYKYLVIKNSENVSLTSYQDISIIGFLRRTFQDPTIPTLPILIAMVIIYGIPYLRISAYSNTAFRMLLLASTLMFPVLFSSASESSTYIIVFVGIAIWFVIQPKLTWDVWLLLLLAIFFGSLNTTDLYPYSWRSWLRLHSIKALPCTIIWLRIIYEMTFRDLSGYRIPVISK